MLEKFISMSAALILMGSTQMAVAQSAELFLSLEGSDLASLYLGHQSTGSSSNQLTVKASRFAGSELDQFIEARLNQVSMAGRAIDPFGLYQDTTVKPVVKKEEIKRVIRSNPSAPKTPLSEIVKLIKITTLIPAENTFLIGSRAFKQGDEMEVVYQGQPMTLKVIGVSGSEVAFKNLDTQEEAILKVEILPAGMRATGDDVNPPGFIGADENAPLQLNAPSVQKR